MFQQAGNISIGAGGDLGVYYTTFKYTSGSNSAGLFVQNCSIDLDAASSASTVLAVGTNKLIGQDAANITLDVQANTSYGYAYLYLLPGSTISQLVLLDSASGYSANLYMDSAASFTNNGTIAASSTG